MSLNIQEKRYIYIIGNGFDLAHGLKTSYHDFMVWYLKEVFHKVNDNGQYDDNLIGVKKVVFSDNFIVDQYNSVKGLIDRAKFLKWEIKYKGFFEQFVNEFVQKRWCDIERKYFELLHQIYLRAREENNGIVVSISKKIEKDLDALNDNLDNIKHALVNYLSTSSCKTENSIPEIQNIIMESDSIVPENWIVLILNFNYTTTISQYIPKDNGEFFSSKLGTSKYEEILNIHGSLQDSSGIIFGYGHNDELFEEIRTCRVSKFVKHFKNDKYDTSSMKLQKFIDKSGGYEVKILGHSCGDSDSFLLKPIFENSKCSGIKIYYHEENDGEKIKDNYQEIKTAIQHHFSDISKMNVHPKVESRPLLPLSQEISKQLN